MNQTQHTILHKPWAWCAIVIVGSALVGAWNAQAPHFSTLQEPISPTKQPASPIEQIEATLAQAGCPGWMVLASEGESAFQPPSQQIVPDDIQTTSSRTLAQVPHVKYPVPVRIASRTLVAPPAANASLSPGSPNDPDDLLDGKPDLLLDKIQTPKKTNETPPAKPVPPPIALPAPKVEEPQRLQPIPPVEQTPTAQPTAPAKQSPPTAPVPMPPVEIAPVTPAPPFESKPIASPAIKGPSLKPDAQTTATPPLKETLPSINTPPAEESIATPTPSTTPLAPSTPASPFLPPPIPAASAPHSVAPTPTPPTNNTSKKKSYCEFIADTQFPSAQACAKCHQKNYDEWSVSSHAYAMVSPMFHKFEQTINDLSQGTSGYFCYRCHSPVGTTLGISRAAPLWDLPPVAREGVTCVACHRINERFGKVNGDRRLEPGDIHSPIYGPIGGAGVAEVIAKKDYYKVKTSPHNRGPGQDIHVAGVYFDQLSKSEFCSSCHQVAVHPGIKLEVVWEQYRASPACKKGISCQDCHMGRIPGVPSGYEVGAVAKVNDKVVHPRRKHANHTFYGPGYSIAHPGIFPFNPKAERWTIPEWLLFDYRAGWGTEEFEERLEASQIQVSFPPVWAEVDDRYDAREIIEDNQKKLDSKKFSRLQIMENGSHVDGPFFDSPLTRSGDLRFHYVMSNMNEGHNLPTGSLGAQPQLWANVVLINPQGFRVWESGYTDRWGDVADIHSEDVRNKRLPFDWQLFNLQTMFLITSANGTDREFFLPVNFDIDQIPFLRPGAQPISVMNHPPFIRMESRSLAPLGSRRIPYKVPAHLLQQPGRYRLSFRLRSRTEPIYFMRFVGSTREMQRAMNEGILDFHESSVEFLIR